MAIPPCGRFKHELTLPSDWHGGLGGWVLSSSDPPAPTGEPIVDDRLVGFSPRIRLEHLGVPEVGTVSESGAVLPRVERTRVVLSAATESRSRVREASFEISTDFLRVGEPDDELHLARGPMGGVAMSILRGGQLLAAAGEVHNIPLGRDVRVFLPFELRAEAELVFQRVDPSFSLREVPLAFSIGDKTKLLREGRCDFAGYSVFVHAFDIRSAPGCVSASISRTDVCSPVAGSTATQLLAMSGLSLTEWQVGS